MAADVLKRIFACSAAPPSENGAEDQLKRRTQQDAYAFITRAAEGRGINFSSGDVEERREEALEPEMQMKAGLTFR